MTNPKGTADLVLHPVRLRIIQSLLGGRALTTADIAAELGDVSKATIYRQVAILAEAGFLEVVDERRVRGAVERTYRLHAGAPEVTAEDLARMSPEDHRQAFAAFVAGLLSNFDAYVDRGDIDLVRDRVGYRHNALWLSDAELDEFLSRTREAAMPYVMNGPGEGRVRRLISNVIIPDLAEK